MFLKQKMGYETDFEGELNIRPRLADEFVARFNNVASRHNNIYGDGEEGSFDHLVLSPWLSSFSFALSLNIARVPGSLGKEAPQQELESM